MVGGAGRLAMTLLAALLSVVLIAGCGGSGDSSGSSETGEASATFIVPGQSNEVAKFGHEADAAEREAASEVLTANLEAREAKDWEGQCETLTNKMAQEFIKKGEVVGTGDTCGKVLAEEGEAASESILENTMTGPIDALRIKGNKAYALFHGKGGKNYAMEMVKEDGKWAVDSVTTIELPSAKN